MAVAGLAMAAAVQPAEAANISWDTRGRFEVCLEARMDAWISAKAALVVNEDPAASDIDDIDVALWAVQTLETCVQQAGRGNQTSEGRFASHMARWRDHIEAVAEGIRRKGGAD
jgi:hypothetical protein